MCNLLETLAVAKRVKRAKKILASMLFLNIFDFDFNFLSYQERRE